VAVRRSLELNRFTPTPVCNKAYGEEAQTDAGGWQGPSTTPPRVVDTRP
jgi:hypothetical protein